MNDKLKKGLLITAASVVFVGLIAIAPFSRIVYAIWDKNRTDAIIKELEDKKNNSGGEEEQKDVVRKAFYTGSENGYTFDCLVLVDETNYELTHYERSETATLLHYHTQGEYTIENNVVTLTDITTDVSTLYENGVYATGNLPEARQKIYDSIYAETSFALQSDGSFTVGGTSDTTEEIMGNAEVYFLYDSSSRPTYKSLALFSDNTYVVSGFSLNSKNHEEAAGSFIGRGTYSIKEKDVVSLEEKPDETYSVVDLAPGYGYNFASNNGSLMGFECITPGGFNQWFMMSLSGTATAEPRVSQTGYSYVAGAKTESFGKWSLSFVDTSANTPDTPVEAEDIRLEVETSVEGKPFILTLKTDGTLTTGWTNYETTLKDGTWYFASGELKLDLGNSGYTAVTEKNGDGSLSVTVNYGQMGEKLYVLTADQLKALSSIVPVVEDIRLEVETSVEGKPFILTLKSDGTLTTGWTNYETTLKDGAWRIIDGELYLHLGDSGYTEKVEKNGDGSISITVGYGQMGEKVYVLTAQQFNALSSIVPVVKDIQLEVASSTEGKPFVLTLKADGTLTTGWTNYETTLKDGAWSIENNTLAIDLGDTGYIATVEKNADGTLSITVNYGQMGDKVYTMTAMQYYELSTITPAVQDVEMEVASSTEGKPFILTLRTDGTLKTGWTNYESTVKEGSWSIVNGEIKFNLGETGYTATVEKNADGTLSITVNYGQMGNKVYTMTEKQFNALSSVAPAAQDLQLEVETSVAGKPFILKFNTDGTLTTGWTNYASTVKEGSWSIENGELILDLTEAGYTAKIEKKEDGSLTITIGYGQMGEKVYTMTAAQFASIGG